MKDLALLAALLQSQFLLNLLKKSLLVHDVDVLAKIEKAMAFNYHGLDLIRVAASIADQ